MRRKTTKLALRLIFVSVLLMMASGCVVRATPGTVHVGPPRPITVRTAPPPPPPRAVLVAPAARPGYVFVRGHYQWSGRRWVWVSHRYIPVRAGHRYVQPHYDANRHVWVRGHWVRGGAAVRVNRRGRRPPPPTRRRRGRRPAPPPPPSPPR